MTKKQANKQVKKKMSPSFQRKVERARRSKMHAAHLEHRGSLQGPKWLPLSERCGSVASPEELAEIERTESLVQSVEAAVYAFPPAQEQIVLEQAGAVCLVRFARKLGGFVVNLDDESQHAHWRTVVRDWCAPAEQVTLRRADVAIVVKR